MLQRNDLRTLALRPERAENTVLTVYLDVDQSQQANLNRGFERQLEGMLASVRVNIHAAKRKRARSVSAIARNLKNCAQLKNAKRKRDSAQPQENDGEMKAFAIASKRAHDFVARYHVGARGLAIVFDASDGYFWGQETDFPIRNQIRWGREVFVGPLAVAIDEYERVGIVLLDRANLRLFSMFLGEVEEHIQEGFSHRKVRHIKTVGMDHLGSASHVQRKADEQIRLNLRHAAKDMDLMLEQHGVRRIVLAGSPEIIAELRAVLPKRLQSQLIGTVDLAISATIGEVRSAAAPLAEKFERDAENKLVQDLVTSAAKSTRVVIGLGHTLYALNQRRIWQLVYAEGFHSPGYECPACTALFSVETSSCSSCGSVVTSIEDVVERAVDQAVRRGAKVEVIRGEEAESSLMNAGGIGAFLRTRTASVLVS